MAKMNRVTLELLFISALCAVVSTVACVQGHPRRWLLVTLTALIALLMILAQLGHNRQVRTLKGKRGRRRRQLQA